MFQTFSQVEEGVVFQTIYQLQGSTPISQVEGVVFQISQVEGSTPVSQVEGGAFREVYQVEGSTPNFPSGGGFPETISSGNRIQVRLNLLFQ